MFNSSRTISLFQIHNILVSSGNLLSTQCCRIALFVFTCSRNLPIDDFHPAGRRRNHCSNHLFVHLHNSFPWSIMDCPLEGHPLLQLSSSILDVVALVLIQWLMNMTIPSLCSVFWKCTSIGRNLVVVAELVGWTLGEFDHSSTAIAIARYRTYTLRKAPHRS